MFLNTWLRLRRRLPMRMNRFNAFNSRIEFPAEVINLFFILLLLPPTQYKTSKAYIATTRSDQILGCRVQQPYSCHCIPLLQFQQCERNYWITGTPQLLCVLNGWLLASSKRRMNRRRQQDCQHCDRHK